MRGDFTEILPFPQISYVQQIHVVYRKTCSKRKLYRVHIHIYGTLDPCCLKQSWNNNTGIISRNWNSIKLMALDRIWLSKSSNIWSLLQSFFPCSRKNEFYGFSLKKNFLTLVLLSIIKMIMPWCSHSASSLLYRKLAWNTRIEY